MSKPLTVDLPFPTTDDVCPDFRSLKIIQSAYASTRGELNAIMQYSYHAISFENARQKECAELLESIAVAEMMHFKTVGLLICKLGAQPIFSAQPPVPFNFYNTKFVNYTCNLLNMVEDDVIGETQAVCSYEQMLKKLKNERVKDVIERILMDEKLHLEKLKELYCKLKR